MVPGDAIGQDWSFSDDHQLHRLIRVYQDRKGIDVKHRPCEPEPEPVKDAQKPFDDWGRWKDDSQPPPPQGILWWQDHDLARRLAKYIQPERIDRTVVKAHMAQEKKSSRWGLFKKNDPTPASPPPPPVQNKDPVTMTVDAEEVTFRRENEMGIWETSTGWGLVVRVKIRQ